PPRPTVPDPRPGPDRATAMTIVHGCDIPRDGMERFLISRAVDCSGGRSDAPPRGNSRAIARAGRSGAAHRVQREPVAGAELGPESLHASARHDLVAVVGGVADAD